MKQTIKILLTSLAIASVWNAQAPAPANAPAAHRAQGKSAHAGLPQPKEQVVFAASDVTTGSVFTADIVQTKLIEKRKIPKGATTKVDDVIGHIALTDVPANTAIIETSVGFKPFAHPYMKGSGSGSNESSKPAENKPANGSK